MAKSRKFSVRLLKSGINFEDAYKEDANLILISKDDTYTVYITQKTRNIPWWKNYLEISSNLVNQSNSAILTIKANDRTFVYTFGFAYNKLKQECFEENFGFLVTINSLNGSKLKSIDAYTPASNTKQKRVVSSILSNIYEYDFNDNQDLVQKLSGVIKDEYKELFTNPTGTDSLSINSKSTKSELKNISEKLLERFSSQDYTNDPYLKNINRIQKANSQKTDELNRLLLEKLNSQDYSDIYMADFEILQLEDFYGYKFGDSIFFDLYIENLNLGQDLTLEKLKSMKISILKSEDDTHPLQWNLYKCLVFDCENNFLSKGSVYEIEQNFLSNINVFLSSYKIPNILPNAHLNELEGDYNNRIKDDETLFLLDEKCPTIEGRGGIEICDLYNKSNSQFIHIKKSERSSSLSHLWNQGIVSEQLANIKHPRYLEKFHEIVGISLPEERNIYYGIIRKTEHLPIFSKISLYNSINILKSMGKNDNEVKYFFIGIDDE